MSDALEELKRIADELERYAASAAPMATRPEAKEFAIGIRAAIAAWEKERAGWATERLRQLLALRREVEAVKNEILSFPYLDAWRKASADRLDKALRGE